MPRILLVEDHHSLAALRCAMLRKQKYTVAMTGDGREACRLLRQKSSESFDLVVTDSQLTAGSGWEVARAARKQHVPVILSTGWPPPASRSGEVDFVLAKPSSMAQFLALVHLALRKTRPTSSAMK